MTSFRPSAAERRNRARSLARLPRFQEPGRHPRAPRLPCARRARAARGVLARAVDGGRGARAVCGVCGELGARLRAAPPRRRSPLLCGYCCLRTPQVTRRCRRSQLAFFVDVQARENRAAAMLLPAAPHVPAGAFRYAAVTTASPVSPPRVSVESPPTSLTATSASVPRRILYLIPVTALVLSALHPGNPPHPQAVLGVVCVQRGAGSS